jgi:type I restriction enzyme, S subunit
MIRLKYLVERRVDRSFPNGKYVGLENVESWTGRHIETESNAEGEAIAFSSGDVLLGKLRPYLAKVFAPDLDGVCTSEFLVLRPRSGICSRFLFYSLLSRDFIDLVTAYSAGAKMPRAEWDEIGNIRRDLPAPEQQRAIADFLDRETKLIDALVEKKERLI